MISFKVRQKALLLLIAVRLLTYLPPYQLILAGLGISKTLAGKNATLRCADVIRITEINDLVNDHVYSYAGNCIYS